MDKLTEDKLTEDKLTKDKLTKDKLTEEVLLQRASPKANQLEQIRTLDLSRMGLRLQDLPVGLLSRLHALETWDLSGNRLQDFPRTLRLPALRRLDLSGNQMEDVSALRGLDALQELCLEDNLYVTVSDSYKLMVLLPSLRTYNRKDVSSTANHLRSVYCQQLRTRVAAVWERSFRLPHPITPDSMSVLEKNFVNAARQQVKYGPSSVSDFTKWKVENLAKEFLRSLTEPQEDPDPAHKNKRKQAEPVMDGIVRLTPRKKPRSEPRPSSAEASPQKSSLRLRPETPAPIRMSPRKTVKAPAAPSRGRAGTSRKSPAARQEDAADRRTQSDAVTMATIKTKEQPVCLQPVHVLQCHSKQDSRDDLSTQLWGCAFQPLLDSSGEGGGRMVATCGGDSVCVIDCETGMVMKKYKVPGEEFFSVAWSTVWMPTGRQPAAQLCSILAAGGKRGLVKLIHPRNNVAYGEFRASRKQLSVLRFSLQQPSFLFTGSYDNRIVMWDIGGVDDRYNYKVVQLLVMELSSTPLHICLPPSSPTSHLLTACEDGLHCCSTALGASKRTENVEITFPIYEEEDEDHDYHTIDGLSFLTDDIVASKSFMHGSIYLWSLTRTRSQRAARRSQVSAVVLAELQWASTEVPYLSLNTCPGRAYVVCGDDRGRIWTYHVPNLQKASFQTKTAIRPTQVLDWPAPMRDGLGPMEGPSINAVAMDPELRYLVALSDKNMVIIWKREES